MMIRWKESLGSLPRRIVIFRALKLGDMLCAVPAFRAIRFGFPQAEIVLVGLPWAREFVDRYHAYLDGFREFPGYPGLPERKVEDAEVRAFFEAMRSDAFDLALQMHGSGLISNSIVTQFGAGMRAGFYEPSQICPDPTTFLPYPNHGLEIERLLRLVEHLGIPRKGEFLEFPISDRELDGARQLRESLGLRPHKYICIHGGASVPERRWPPHLFASVADALAERGYTIVLTGSAGEAELTAAVAQGMRHAAIDLAGQTPLGILAGLLLQAQLLIGNDTGVSHVAAALKLPSVVISTGDNPSRWAPTDRLRHRTLCRDSGVTAQEVLAEAQHLLIHASRLALRDRRNFGWQAASGAKSS